MLQLRKQTNNNGTMHVIIDPDLDPDPEIDMITTMQFQTKANQYLMRMQSSEDQASTTQYMHPIIIITTTLASTPTTTTVTSRTT